MNRLLLYFPKIEICLCYVYISIYLLCKNKTKKVEQITHRSMKSRSYENIQTVHFVLQNCPFYLCCIICGKL